MKVCSACRSVYPDFYESCPRDHAPLTKVGGRIKAGSILRGKYEVLEQLGKGGMASVFKVRHMAFHDLAAIKVGHRELMTEEFLRRFQNEAVVARQLKHPNAVRIEDFDFTDDGQPFIVMEYVHGRSLYEVRKGDARAVGEREGLRIAAGAAGALEAAHGLGIVHRDIKPSNVMLAEDGTVKVLDFGVAKVQGVGFAGMASVETHASMIVGTPEYMSPEQATLADETAIDGRSDLYSLGVVLYEMVTGVHPFRAETPIGMLMQQVQSNPIAPSVVGGVSPAVSAVILKALRKRPEERFQTAGEMLAALRDPETWFAGETASVAMVGARASGIRTVAPTEAIDPPSKRMRRSAADLPTAKRFAESSLPERKVVVSRGRSWPVILLLIVLLIAVGAAVVWFYGQEHPGFDWHKLLSSLTQAHSRLSPGTSKVKLRRADPGYRW
jgi:serine/threonine protein kinase